MRYNIFLVNTCHQCILYPGNRSQLDVHTFIDCTLSLLDTKYAYRSSRSQEIFSRIVFYKYTVIKFTNFNKLLTARRNITAGGICFLLVRMYLKILMPIRIPCYAKLSCRVPHVARPDQNLRHTNPVCHRMHPTKRAGNLGMTN